MSANYWTSSQYNHWTVTRLELLASRKNDLRLVELSDIMKLHIYFANVIQGVGKKFRLRQEIVATGIVFFKRFYLKNSFYNTDPFLVATACLYSACKVEELPHHLKSIVNEVRSYLASHKVPFKYEYCDVAEFECYLLEELDFYMIIYHPYHTLIKVFDDFKSEHSFLQTAWYLVNDSFRTDVCLIYPPHLIAIAALYITCVINKNKGADLIAWFAKLNVDMAEVMEIAQDIIAMYDVWNNFKEGQALSTLDLLRTKARTLKME